MAIEAEAISFSYDEPLLIPGLLHGRDARLPRLRGGVTHGMGGAEVMQAQFQHLLEVGSLRNVSIQILPFGRCSGVALNGPIVLLETGEHELYAFADGQGTSALYANPSKVSELARKHDVIRVHALSVEESAESSRRVAEKQ